MDHETKDVEDVALRNDDPVGRAWGMSAMLDGECIDGPSGMNAACEDRDGSWPSDWG